MLACVSDSDLGYRDFNKSNATHLDVTCAHYDTANLSVADLVDMYGGTKTADYYYTTTLGAKVDSMDRALFDLKTKGPASKSFEREASMLMVW